MRRPLAIPVGADTLAAFVVEDGEATARQRIQPVDAQPQLLPGEVEARRLLRLPHLKRRPLPLDLEQLAHQARGAAALARQRGARDRVLAR